MASSSVLCDSEGAVRSVGATDVLIYRRAVGGRFVLTAPPLAPAADELTIDDEPVVARALQDGLQRVASEQPRVLCAGYVARTAAVVAVDRDVVVVLGRRDGCLAAVSDEELVSAAKAAAMRPIGS